MKYENLELCKQCQGRCCKSGPCNYLPEDFKQPLTKDFLIQKIKDTGYISIVLALYPTSVVYLRPRRKNGPIVELPIKLEGESECCLLTPTGCKLSYEERPSQGKMLKPKMKNNQFVCESQLSAQEIAAAWQPYQRLLKEVAEEFL